MKTIELTIPTSIRELGLRDMVLSTLSHISASVSQLISSLINTIRVKKNTFILSFSSFNKINFESDYATQSEVSTARKDRRKRFSLEFLNNKKLVKFGIYLVILVLLIGLGRSVFKSSVKSESGNKLEIAEPTDTTTVDRTYQFPFYDESGEVISDFQYTIERAELRNEVLVQGRPAQAINGKTFLVIYVKIKNEYKGSLQLNASEYVRLVVDGNEDELMAPEMNSDPVQIQAISTKSTRIGFPIDEANTDDLKLQIGEIDGEKDIIEIKF